MCVCRGSGVCRGRKCGYVGEVVVIVMVSMSEGCKERGDGFKEGGDGSVGDVMWESGRR